jgi:hypothetical protein
LANNNPLELSSNGALYTKDIVVALVGRRGGTASRAIHNIVLPIAGWDFELQQSCRWPVGQQTRALGEND